jgi:hypothetical protein
MKYEELPPISRDELKHALDGRDPDEAARAILRMALHEADFAWAERKCLDALHDSRETVRAAAVIGLGHLARIHRAPIDPGIVEELKKLQAHPKLAGLAEDALDDILMFASSQAPTN